MTIDWFTFSAQIVNFLILIWLMKKFLYGPVVKAMDEREARIAAQLEDAEQAERAARTRESEYQTQLNELAESRSHVLAEAHQDADAWKKEQMQQAKQEVETSRKLWEQSFARSRQALLQEIRQNITHHVTEVSRHVLAQLADEELQSLMVRRFVALLQQNTGTELDLHAGSHHIVLASSHLLPQGERDQILEALAPFDVNSTNVRFQQNPDLICGIELRSADRKLAWNVRDLVDDLQSDLTKSISRAEGDRSVTAEAQQIEPMEDKNAVDTNA